MFHAQMLFFLLCIHQAFSSGSSLGSSRGSTESTRTQSSFFSLWLGCDSCWGTAAAENNILIVTYGGCSGTVLLSISSQYNVKLEYQTIALYIFFTCISQHYCMSFRPGKEVVKTCLCNPAVRIICNICSVLCLINYFFRRNLLQTSLFWTDWQHVVYQMSACFLLSISRRRYPSRFGLRCFISERLFS